MPGMGDGEVEHDGRRAQGMSGTRGGTGRPLHFRCSWCRRTDVPWPYGAAQRVVLTGRARSKRDGRSSGRNSDTERQYSCGDCGHLGWSRHADLEHKINNARKMLREEKTP